MDDLNRIRSFRAQWLRLSILVSVLASVIGCSVGCTGSFPDFKGGRWPSPNVQNTKKNVSSNIDALHKIPVVPVVKDTKESEFSPAKVIPSGTLSGEEVTFFYKVKEPGLSLGLLSQVAYGTKDRWHEIVQWNQLKIPYHLHVGQKIKLKMPKEYSEKLSDEEFNIRLLRIWRKKLQEEDTSIHLNDHVRRISSAKKDVQIILFSKHARVYRVDTRRPDSSSLLGCLKNSLKTHTSVRIAATRTQHEIVQCQ